MIPLDIQEVSVKRTARNVNRRGVFPTVVGMVVDRVAIGSVIANDNEKAASR
jgi:hypothetical protein